MKYLKTILLAVFSCCIVPSQQLFEDIIFPPPRPQDQNLGPDSEGLPGHLKPLGWQSAPDGPVKEYDEILSTQDYWDKHVKTRTPLVFRGAIKGLVFYAL